MTRIESSPPVSRQGLAPADRSIVWVEGEHDISTASALAETLNQAIAFVDADLVLDMSGVTFMDASTMKVVIRARGDLRRHARSLTVRSPSTCVRRILDICDLTDLIDPHPAGAAPVPRDAPSPEPPASLLGSIPRSSSLRPT